MWRETITKRYFSTLYLILIVASLFFLVYSHEAVHQEIYRSYDIESEMHLFSFPYPYVQGEEPCPNEFCIMAHNFNEVVGYQLMPFILLIGFGFYFIIFFLEEIAEYYNH